MVFVGDILDVMEMFDIWLLFYVNNGMFESFEFYFKKWDMMVDFFDWVFEFGWDVKNIVYMLFYGFYLWVMFYNKKFFVEVGIFEFLKMMDEFFVDLKKVLVFFGKYGYCLCGGFGGLNGWVMFGVFMVGFNEFFIKDG